MIYLDMNRYTKLGPDREVVNDWLRSEDLLDKAIVRIDVIDESGCALRCTAFERDENGRYRVEGDEAVTYEFAAVTAAPFPIAVLDRLTTLEGKP